MPGYQVPKLSLLQYQEGHEYQRTQFVQQLFNGIKDCGFVILADHPVSQSKIDQAYQQTRKFFALSSATKENYSGEHNGGQRGYTSLGKEHAKDHPHPDLKEFWHVGRKLSPHHPYAHYYPPNVWPQELPHFRSAMEQLYQAMDQTSQLLLSALGEALGAPKHYFAQMIEEGNSILRLIHYPPVPPQVHPQRVRAAAHGDINLITLLVGATDSGLQLLDREGQWNNVSGGCEEIIVNSGDMLSRITNEVIPSTIHRVINPDNSRSQRYSMPYFVHPHPPAQLRCLDSCEGRRGALYPPITSHEFLQQRLEEIGLK